MARSRFTENFNVKAVDSDAPDGSWVLPNHFVGVEFEIENTRRFSFRSSYYDPKEDGSLRGGREYVFSRPLSGTSLTAAINEFYNHLGLYEGADRPVTSYRTGLHVHLNFSRGGEVDNIHQLRAMVAAYYLVEGLMYKHAGVDRKWCGYCWSFSDADGLLYDVLDQEKNESEVAHCVSRASRYYGLNIRSLAQHGTLEFRHMEMTMDRNRTIRWINSIMALRKYAESFGVEEGAYFNVLPDYESLGAEGFVRKVFGDTAEDFIQHIDETDMEQRVAILRNCVSEARQSAVKEHRYLQSRNPLYAKLVNGETDKPVVKKKAVTKQASAPQAASYFIDEFPTPVRPRFEPGQTLDTTSMRSGPSVSPALWPSLEESDAMLERYREVLRSSPSLFTSSTPVRTAPRPISRNR